jgi:class 3 adenylate cyclase/tetratricopeptide (TPR) repeat protein
MNEIEKLEQGIAALEAQRGVLGDAVVDAMLGPIREKLSALKAQQSEQRKQVSVLFADLSGFTALSETLDVEEVRERLNRLWERLDTIITAHGGRVDKHIGDEVMALWGTETTREDDPERAIRAALEMQASLAEFRKMQSYNLTMRIGINTGLVILGTVGTIHEYTAMGDTVNLASRLQHAAPVGGVLISHNTYRQVRGIFDVLTREPLAVKGKTEPVQTYVIVQVKPRTFRVRTRGVEGIETRMVGRAGELGRLQDMLRTVITERELHWITISGEAGVGKSRLLYEFQNWMDLLPTEIWAFKGRATEAMRSLPYALLRDIFAYRFEIADSDSLGVAQEKLERGIVAFMPEDPDAVMKAHFIGHLIGLDFLNSEFLRGIRDDPKQIRSLAFHYLGQFFEAVGCKACPAITVLLLDDLHWADDGSLDALTYLKQTLHNLPLLVIGLTRPVLFERHPNWSSDLRLDLQPLSEDESHKLVDEIFKKVTQVPKELRDLLVGGAEGNPFYLEELVKMLIDQKVILPGDLAWTVEPAHLASVKVPATLTGVLQARLDNLPGAEMETLQRASVVGRIFWDSAVGALSDNPSLNLYPMLRSLRAREFVFERGQSSFSGTGEYIFKHALLREVTYETVLKRLRRIYHARAAAWLSQQSGERAGEYAGLIAEHYEQAGEALQAAGWYNRAGEAAITRSAFTTAVNYFTRALDLTPPGDPSFSALARQLGDTNFRIGDLSAARLALQNAQASAQTATDQAAALATLAELTGEAGDYAGARALLAEAVPLARSSADRVTLTRALFALGSADWRLGKLGEAQSAFEECLELARELGDVTRELYALNRLGAVAIGAGNLMEAERLWKEVYTRAVVVGNRERAMVAMNNLGSVASGRHDFATARDYIQESLKLARELGAQQTIALALINLGETYIHLGYLVEARSGLREGLALALHLGLLPRVVGAVIFFANLAHAEGDVKRALALWGMARNHPAWNSDHQRELDAALADWNLPTSIVGAGLTEGAHQNWDATLQELLAV